jgi:hypothetical protein
VTLMKDLSNLIVTTRETGRVDPATVVAVVRAWRCD